MAPGKASEAASGAGQPGSFARQLATLRRLLPFLWPRERRDLRLRVAGAVVLLVLAKLATVLVPYVFGRSVDALTPFDDAGPDGAVLALPLVLLAAYGLTRFAGRGFGELRDALFARVAQNAIRRVGLQVFRHLHALSLRFHLDRQTGGLNRAIERGTKGIEFLLFFVLFNVAPTILEVFLVCGILWYLFDWTYAAVTAVTILAYVALTFRMTEWRLRFRRAMNEADSDANTRAIDSLLNYETVKYFNNEGHEARRFDGGLARYEEAATRSRVTLSMLNMGQAAVLALGITAIMALAALDIAAGRASVGDFAMVNAYLIQLSIPLNMLGTVYREIKQSLVDMEAMYDLLDQPAEVKDAPGAPALALEGGEVVFEDVNFGYDPRRPILHGVSFRVPAGRKLAIVGPSGAGKSTISRLLFRFYDLDSGVIRIDGQNIRQVTQNSLRAAIGIVPQDTVLFNDTIFYNIAYGRPEASEAEVFAAARMAQIHDFAQGLPEGYATRVGERGLKLSGGEKQRVAIARAILKRPAIMLFDEATSALDTGTEREIQTALAEVARGRTTLVVAHRLSTVVDADEILVLEAGRVVERGSHTELLAAGGVYAAMWARQLSAEDASGALQPALQER